MTIAAGFRVEDGVLLCADTMYTGAMKIHQQKIFPVSFRDGGGEHPEHFVFALAGNEAYAKTAIDKCTEALTDLGPEKRTLRNVKKELRSVMKLIYDTYIYSRPESERLSLEFQFMIGAWLPRGGGAQLFSTEGPMVNLQHDYDCIGTGAYLGHYLIRPVFSQMLKMPAVMTLASQMLAAAKEYDTNCGGLSTCAIIKDGEVNPSYGYQFHTAETFITHYDGLSRQLLLYIADPEIDDVVFQRQLEVFTDSVKRIRENWPKLG
jgi:20S proteasome alpha/beta subunit